MTERIVKFRRVLEYEGPESWVRATLKQSFVLPVVPMGVVYRPRGIRQTELTDITEISKEETDADRD